MDRFFTIRFPLKYGRNKTRKLMMIKISLVWLISFSITLPLLVLGYENPTVFFSVENSICALNHSQFKLYGSIFAFYIPFFIIAITYSFTIVSLKKIIKKKEICLQSNKNEKKSSLFSNYFLNSDKSSRTNSIGNPETKRQYLVNLPLISKNYLSQILSKKDNFQDRQIFNSGNQLVEKKLHKIHLKKSKSDSKLNKPPNVESFFISRSERNSINKKMEKPIGKPLDNLLMNYKGSSLYKKCKNLCQDQNFIDKKEIPILLLKYSHKQNELNLEFLDNRTRKNSNVSFGSFSFFEYHNSSRDTRKMSHNISLLSRFSFKSKKKSILSSADLILRSNSLFSSSTKQNIKMYSRQNNEEKALKVLMIIFLMFVLFWSPFFIVNIASVLYKDFLFLNNYQLILGITWLGYTSSMINPIIYTMFNKSFRKAFLNLLKCRTKIQNQFKRQNRLINKKLNHDSTKNSKIYV